MLDGERREDDEPRRDEAGRVVEGAAPDGPEQGQRRQREGDVQQPAEQVELAAIGEKSGS